MSRTTIGVIGAYDARARFAELLDCVAQGEEVTITRHGAPIARLVPVRKVSSVAERQAAVAEMRRLASRQRLRGLKIKDLIAEGRR